MVVYAKVCEQDRAALIGARLVIAEGRVERVNEHAEVPILQVIMRRRIMRTGLLNGLGKVGDTEAGWDRLIGRADEVRRRDPGSRRPVKMPPSRDFR